MSGWLLAAEILLFLQGAYAQIFQAEAAREMAARFGGTELCFVAVMVASMAWVAAGCFAASALNRSRGEGSFGFAACLCALSPVSAMCSYAFIAGGPPIIDLAGGGLLFSVGEMLVYGLVGPMTFGVLNGALFGAVCGVLKKDVAGQSYAADALGALAGGVLFSIVLASRCPPLSTLSIAGALIPMLGFAVCGRLVKSVWTRILCGVFCSLCVAFAGLFGGSDGEIAELKWGRMLPGYAYEGAVETAGGRVEFLKDLRGPSGQLAIYRDGELEATLPKEREPEFPAALFAVSQTGHCDLSVLLVCSPFSVMPDVMERLPAVARVELVAEDARLAELARQAGILPEDSERFKLTIAEPRRHVETTKERYDVIMTLDVAPSTLGSNRLFTQEFFEAVNARLEPKGVYVTSIESSPGYSSEATLEFNGSLDATLRSVFAKVAFTPGSLKLAAAGNGLVTGEFDVLDARVFSMMQGCRLFPEGLLGVVFSQAEQSGESMKVSQASVAASLNKDLSPTLPYLRMQRHARMVSGDAGTPGLLMEGLEWALFFWKELGLGVLAIYAVLRYFLSWKMSRKMAFLSFENGFFASGAAIMLLFLHQTRCGALYRDLAIAAGVFMGGAALGALLRSKAPKASDVFKWLSPLVVLLSPLIVLLPPEAALAAVFSGLFIAGASVGAGYSEFNANADSPHSPGFLWSAEAFGGAAGALVITLFLLPAGGFAVCAAALALSRLPFLLGK